MKRRLNPYLEKPVRWHNANKTTSKHWWEKEPLRIIEIVDCFDFKRLDPEKIAETVKKLAGNVQHFHCMELSTKRYGPGLDDRSLYFKTRLAAEHNPDRLAEYIPVAKKYGIRVIVYFNVHWYSPDFGKKHPDWVQIKEDGYPVNNVYGTGISFCINSPYREWVFQILKDLCQYEIDGIFFDGPIFFSSTCYCRYCRELFRKNTGENIPPKSERNHPLWKQLIEFQAESMEKFLAESNQIIKNINPEILFYINGNSNWPYWPTGRDNHRIIKHTDILGAEGGFLYGNLNQTVVFKPALTGKLLTSQSEGKPTVVFDCAGHKPWSWYVLPSAEIALLLYQTCFSGAYYWLAIFPDDIDQPEINTVSKFGKFIEKHPSPFYKTHSLASTALVWPTKSAEFYRGSTVPLTDFTSVIEGEEIGNLHKEFEGFYKCLSKNQIVFDVIDENCFDRLSRYSLVILPNAACLSSDDCAKLKEFVYNGGNLISVFETSLYDENGKLRDNFGLAEVFGIMHAGNIIGPMNFDYITPVERKKIPYLKNITKKFIPAPVYGISVKNTTGKTEIFFCKKLKGRYDNVPEISKNPAMVVNKYGKGTSVYFAGNIGNTISEFGFHQYFTLLKNICNHLSPNLITIEGGRNIEVFLRKKERYVYIYLINLTTGLNRPIEFLEPLHQVKIILRKIKPIRIMALKVAKKIKYIKTKRGIELLVPRIEEFEILEILTE